MRIILIMIASLSLVLTQFASCAMAPKYDEMIISTQSVETAGVSSSETTISWDETTLSTEEKLSETDPELSETTGQEKVSPDGVSENNTSEPLQASVAPDTNGETVGMQTKETTEVIEETLSSTEQSAEPSEETTEPTGYVKPAPVKVEITKKPNKEYYAVGETLNTVGMTVTITYDNGKTKNINHITNEVVIEYGENTVAIHYAEDDKVFTNHITVYGAYQVTYKPGTGVFQIGNYPNKVLYTAKGMIIEGEYMEPKMAGMYFDGWYTENGDILDPENISLNGNVTATAKFVEPHR